MQRTSRQHALAVITIALVAIVFGCGFVAMQTVLRGGLSVGAAISVRFVLGTIALLAFLVVRGARPDRKSVRDGLVLGAILVSIFWLQTDGLRFTTTAKSGLITSLYVPFTPIIAFFLKDRIKVAHALAALLAGLGMYLLVHVPGDVWSGWGRGEFETLACAVLCAFHVIYTSRFSRRSDGLVLAFMQVAVTGIVSALIALFLPAPHGFQTMMAGLHQQDVQIAVAFMVCFTTIFCFWGMTTMQKYLSATEAAVVYSFEPVTATLVGVYWVGERFLSSQKIGAALIVVAMLSAELLPRLFARSRRGALVEAPAD